MTIRPAEIRDIPGILSLLRQVGQVHHDIRPDIFRNHALKYDEAALAALLRDETRPIFVAVEEDFVLGYCFCVHKVFRNHETFTDRSECYIDDLCVDEGHRGRGIAKALYRHVTAYAKERGFDTITLNVWCGNDSAMKFYENAGMTPRNILMEMKLC